MMRAKLKALGDAALPKQLKDLTQEELEAVVAKAWGGGWKLTDYTAFVTRWRELEARGVWLAEWIVTYGSPPAPLTRDDIDALDIVQPYAFALRVRLQAEAAKIAAGGIGSQAYYATYTNGDQKEATRLLNQERAKLVAFR